MIRCLFLLATLLSASIAGASKPHIVFFFVDDLGWADLGCYGSAFHETPNIDALSESGVRFTQAYSAASICSPTRASLMSGKHPVRVNITDWIPGARPPKWATLRTPADRHELPLSEVTLAEALRDEGYRTFYAGKWHLGGDGYGPEDQGFDAVVPPDGWKKKGQWKLRAREDPSIERPHETRTFTDRAIEFLEQGAGGDQPMLVFLSYNDVHTPIIPDNRRLAHYKGKAAALSKAGPLLTNRRGKTRPRQDNPDYATMVDAVDQSVGAVLAKVDSLGIADETIVVFYSDNGGLATTGRGGPTSNAPLRSGKGWLYEGGIRVPLIIRAPGVSQANSTCDALAVSMDLYPTLLDLAGCAVQPEQHVDGISLARLVAGGEAANRSLHWHYPHYHGSTWAPGGAIRNGDYKLIEFFETGEVELYDLANDIGESRDLADERPEVARQLRLQLAAWRESIGAAMPIPITAAD